MKNYPFLVFLIKLILTIVVASGTIVSIIVFFTIISFSALIGIFSLGDKEGLRSIKNQEVLYGKEESANIIVSLPIYGVIVGDESDVSDPLGLTTESVTFGYKLKKQLMDLAEEDTVKGILLEINSPGGTIYGAQAIADGVAYYRERTHKPVVTFVSGLAASGGYWAAVSTDRIFADIGSSVGSIGVISGPYKFYNQVISEDGGLFAGGIVTQKGIETTYIIAGKYKDFGNPYRQLTDEEKQAMQRMVNNEYDRFVSFVSDKRTIPPDTIKNSLGALIYDTKTAQENKLIDETNNREYTYNYLREQAGLAEGDYKVIREVSGKGFLKSLLESKFLPSRVSSLCSITKVHLVYYGDISALCQN